ncbi:hypothetical protein B0H65DRAFT_66537 [Neurospora tetraspora]|uniref:Uncharacterized protein n=1 Tax=Neurospora tetraspora TaxID=94610 RepID=A0AAE0JQR0_9PEZI|nr:hypothetical protein B0H65DRAFT_66537 [Neurospora tetraspora]
MPSNHKQPHPTTVSSSHDLTNSHPFPQDSPHNRRKRLHRQRRSSRLRPRRRRRLARLRPHPLHQQQRKSPPIIGAIDDVAAAHESEFILAQLLPPRRVDVVISTTESFWPDYAAHYHNVVALLRRIVASESKAGDGDGDGDGDGEKGIKLKPPLLVFTSGCKDYVRR